MKEFDIQRSTGAEICGLTGAEIYGITDTDLKCITDADMNCVHTMNLCQRLCLYVLIMGPLFGCQTEIFAQQTIPFQSEWYIGTNPVAIPLGFSIKPESKRFLPIVAGNEYGTNLVGTYFFSPNQSIEGRLSLSNVHQLAFVGQFHLGSNYFFRKHSVFAFPP